jgi:hypothetical protein
MHVPIRDERRHAIAQANLQMSPIPAQTRLAVCKTLTIFGLRNLAEKQQNRWRDLSTGYTLQN